MRAIFNDKVEQAHAYRDTFSTPPGRKVLQELEQIYGRRRSYTEGDPYATAAKEGERAVYLRILGLLELAEEVQDKQTVAITDAAPRQRDAITQSDEEAE